MTRPNLIVSISGQPKSGKTHLALTFPPPIAVFSFDIGGIAPIRDKFKDKKIDEFTYPIPIIDSDPPKPYAKAVWEQLDADYKRVVEGGDYKTVVLDTATAIWAIIRHSVAEELAQKKILEVQYTLPNLRMNSLFTRAKLAGVNFVSTQYLRDRYVKNENTGELEVNGWGQTESQVDIALWTQRKERKVGQGRQVYVETTIKDNRYELQLNGEKIENATYEDLCVLLGV